MDRKILIVEDEPDIREALAEALTDAGYQTFTAENGQVGFDIALSEHPDLILLDIKMPIMDGHQMLEKLRLDPWGKSAKVVMLTSMDDTQNVATAYEGKITDYIIKAHHSLDEILNKVRQSLYLG